MAEKSTETKAASSDSPNIEGPGAQDLGYIRRELARAAVRVATTLWEAVVEAEQLTLKRTQSGNFVEAEFAGDPELLHLTEFMVGSLLDDVFPAIKKYIENASPPAANVSRRDLLVQAKKIKVM